MNKRLMSRYFISVGIILGMLGTGLPSSAKTRYWPTGILLGMDVVCPLYYKYYQKTGGQYAFNASMDFAKCMLVGDYGVGSIHWKGYNSKTNTNTNYSSEGQYFRIGLNYNMLRNTPDKNAAFLGVRYATSFFDYESTSGACYNSKGLIKGYTPPKNTKQRNVRAHWCEAVAGVKVKVWKQLYVGGTLRYKFRFRILKGSDAYVPYDVLGWGLYEPKEEGFGLNYYVLLRIPFARNTLPSRSPQA